MRNRIYLTLTLITLSLFSANTGRAAFPLKKEVAATTIVSKQGAADEPAVSSPAPELNPTPSNVTAKKHSFFSRIINKIKKAEEAVILEAAYIVLAIFALGWLGMGINDNFQGFNWVISLLLYCIFYIPGLIYTLIMMGDYY